MGKYSSDSDSSASDRGRRSHKRSNKRSKGRHSSSSPSSSSRRRRDDSRDYQSSSRHKSSYKSRTKDRYSSKKSRNTDKHSRRRSSSSSSNDSRSSRKIRSSSNVPSLKSSSSTNSSSTPRELSNNDLLTSAEQLRIKVQKAIQAASALKIQKTDECAPAAPQISQAAISEIEAPGFTQRTFSSAPRNVSSENAPVVVDITEAKKEDSEIVSRAILDGEDARVEAWGRKLLALRQHYRLRKFGPQTVH